MYNQQHAPFLRSLKLYGALDHGTTGVTASVFVGINQNDDRFALMEYYRSNQLVSYHANEIKVLVKMFADLGLPLEYMLIDPSTTAKTQQGPRELYSVQDEYYRNGINTIAGHRTSIEIGINVIAEFLHSNPNHIHPFRQERGSPALFIVEEFCPNLVREIIELKKEITESQRVVYTGSDHALDCLRYIFMSRPRRPELAPVDLASLTNQERFARRAHDNWTSRWDRSIEQREGTGGSWF